MTNVYTPEQVLSNAAEDFLDATKLYNNGAQHDVSENQMHWRHIEFVDEKNSLAFVATDASPKHWCCN